MLAGFELGSSDHKAKWVLILLLNTYHYEIFKMFNIHLK